MEHVPNETHMVSALGGYIKQTVGHIGPRSRSGVCDQLICSTHGVL